MVHQVPGKDFRASDLPPGRAAVMFTTDWCGYCRRFYPHYKRLKEAWIVDVSDEDDPLWDDHRIRVVPTVILFEDGRETRRWEGALAAHHVDQMETALRAPSPASP